MSEVEQKLNTLDVELRKEVQGLRDQVKELSDLLEAVTEGNAAVDGLLDQFETTFEQLTQNLQSHEDRFARLDQRGFRSE